MLLRGEAKRDSLREDGDKNTNFGGEFSYSMIGRPRYQAVWKNENDLKHVGNHTKDSLKDVYTRNFDGTNKVSHFRKQGADRR